MRVRTDKRRNAIIEAATEIFAKVGYERASMSMIAERTGGSKTTLYGYFPSKEELFWAAMTGAMAEQGEKTLLLLDSANSDIASVLRKFGESYLGIFASRAARPSTFLPPPPMRKGGHGRCTGFGIPSSSVTW